MFSLCLAKNGGQFSVGGINTTFHLANETIKKVPMILEHYYLISFSKIRSHNYSLDVLNSKDFMIDSGTSLTLFTKEIYDFLSKVVKQSCIKENSCNFTEIKIRNDICYLPLKGTTKSDFYRSFDNIEFFDKDSNFTYVWKPQDYIVVLFKKQQPYLCLGFSITDAGKNILGSTWMVNHDIIFDIEEKAYGFSEAKCNPDEIEFNYFLFENCQRLYDYIYALISAILFLLSLVFYLLHRLRKSRQEQSKIRFNKVSTEEVGNISLNDFKL